MRIRLLHGVLLMILEWIFFDDTTYEAERLMYWPSTSTDGEYIFFANDSENCLDPDDVLAAYDDWRDTSTWPESSRANKMRQAAVKKQGDPYEKPGAIGAFCRTYSVPDVIDCFLNDVYEPCGEGRYTYKQGSTSGGLVVYLDLHGAWNSISRLTPDYTGKASSRP